MVFACKKETPPPSSTLPPYQCNETADQNCNAGLHQPFCSFVGHRANKYYYDTLGNLLMDSCVSIAGSCKRYSYLHDYSSGTVVVQIQNGGKTTYDSLANRISLLYSSVGPSIESETFYYLPNGQLYYISQFHGEYNEPYWINEITDSIVYNTDGDLISTYRRMENNYHSNFPMWFFYHGYTYYNYFEDKLFKGEFDPELYYWGGSPRPYINMPQSFSKHLLKSITYETEAPSYGYSNVSFAYTFDEYGNVSSITTTTATSSSTKYLTYCN